MYLSVWYDPIFLIEKKISPLGYEKNPMKVFWKKIWNKFSTCKGYANENKIEGKNSL